MRAPVELQVCDQKVISGASMTQGEDFASPQRWKGRIGRKCLLEGRGRGIIELPDPNTPGGNKRIANDSCDVLKKKVVAT